MPDNQHRHPVQAFLELRHEPEDLQKVEAFVSDFSSKAGLPKEAAYAMDLALTEWITNIRDYGLEGIPEGRIAIALAATTAEVTAVVEDNGRAFNPVEHPDVVVARPLEQRPIGGLGIHLIKDFMDEVTYQRTGELNQLRLTKAIADSRVNR